MKYNAKIEYTINVEKAGKLTLTSESGEVLLFKVPVAMPHEIFTSPKIFKKNQYNRSVQIKMDEDLKRFDKSGSYEDSYVEIIRNNSEGYFIKSIGKVSIKPTNDNKMKNDEHAFVMHKQHFDVIYDILTRKNQLEVETKKVSFLWMPEKIINENDNINFNLVAFENVESKIRKKKEDLEKSTALEAVQKKSKVNTGITKPKLSEKVDNIPNFEKTVQSSIQNSKQSDSKVLSTKNPYRNENDLDALDIVLMYSNPDLAPFIKPSSALAWYLYFNHQVNAIDRNDVEQNIQNVKGFENIESSEFKYTQKGYSITLFDDENKNNPVGKMEFDTQKNCYEVISNHGEKTILSIGDNGEVQSCFKATNGNETKIDLMQTEKGFLGNWEYDNNGVKINSGISFNSDFGYSSTPNETIDLSRVQSSDYNARLVQMFDFEPKQESSYTSERQYTPPPPPPPPRNDESWTSSDPYSNRSSFKM